MVFFIIYGAGFLLGFLCGTSVEVHNNNLTKKKKR